MDSHRKADVELDKLLVNPENYRFDPVANQQEAMLIMLRSQKDKILKLARDIAGRGLNPMERLVVKDVGGDKYVILEGNRRITALKLMTKPDELPGDYPFKDVFGELHAKYKDILPTTVECVIYRTDQQDSADSWILLKHTGENQGVGTVPWNSVQKQRFESRHTGQESKTLQILEFLRENGIDISGLDVTNLERLLETRGVPQMLGIDFPRKKKFILIEPRDTVLQKFRKVVERMSANDFAVSQIYNASQRVQWVQDALASQPAAPTTSIDTRTSPFASSNDNSNMSPVQPSPSLWPDGSAGIQQSPVAGVGTSTLAPTVPTFAPAPTPTSSSSSNYPTLVNPANTLPPTTPAKILEIYKELQTVYITGLRAAPHAVGALLRILVEITAQEYLMKKQGFAYDSNSIFRNPNEQGKSYRELRDKLNYIANQSGLPGNIAQVLRALLGQQLMTAELNQVMHSTIFTADAASIKGLWKNLEKVFDYLIDEMK